MNLHYSFINIINNKRKKTDLFSGSNRVTLKVRYKQYQCNNRLIRTAIGTLFPVSRFDGLVTFQKCINKKNYFTVPIKMAFIERFFDTEDNKRLERNIVTKKK